MSSEALVPRRSSILLNAGANSLDIAQSNAAHLVLVNRSEIQFQTQGRLKQLGTHIKRSAKITRDGIDKLSVMTDKINSIREYLHGSSIVTDTRAKLADELHELNMKSSSKYDTCPLCNAQMLPGFLKNHVQECRGPTQNDYNPDNPEEVEEFKDEKEMQQIKVSNAKRKLIDCPLCGKSLYQSALKKHMVKCRKLQQRRKKKYDPENAIEPQAPSNLVVSRSTSSTLTLVWSAPVFDGGAPILEYELDHMYSHRNDIGKKVIRSYEQQDPISVSFWCLQHPLTCSYILRDLMGDSEFANLRVRCRNEKGWSPYSSVVTLATTKPPQPPDEPFPLRLGGNVTSSQIPLLWSKPMDIGGSPLTGYRITYEITVRAEVGGGGFGEEMRMEERLVTVEAPADVTSFVLDRLVGDMEHRNIRITALNEAGFESEASVLTPVATVTTLPPTRTQIIRDEIIRAEAVTGQFLDSDFFQGFTQRWDKDDYLNKLRTMLESMEQAEAADAKKEAVLEEFKQQKLGVSTKNGKINRRKSLTAAGEHIRTQELIVRQGHFFKKIEQLEDDTERVKEESVKLVEDRAAIMFELQSRQDFLRRIEAELDRVMNLKRQSIDSDVIHGQMQRFDKKELVSQLNIEKKRVETAIISRKRRLVSHHQKIEENKIAVAEMEEMVKDRRSALMDFERKARQQEQSKFLLARWKNSTLLRIIAAWKGYVNERREQRRVLQKIIARASSKQGMAFMQWKLFTRYQRLQIKKLSDEKQGIISVGSRMLAESKVDRENFLKEVSHAVQSVKATGKDIKRAAFTTEQTEAIFKSIYFHKAQYQREQALREKGGELLMEFNLGDHLLGRGECDEAIIHFEAHIIKAQKHLDVLQMAAGSGRLVHCYLRKGEFNKAVIHADRQLGLAREARSHAQEAEALLNAARSHICLKHWSDSLELAERALDKYTSLKDVEGNLAALRVKAMAHNGLFQKAEAAVCERNADHLASNMQQKLNVGKQTLQELKILLVSSSASQGKVVNLERVGLAVPRLRREKRVLKKRIIEMEDRVKARFNAVAAEKAKLQRVHNEQKAAQQSGAVTMDSALVHGQEQRFDVNELLSKLKVVEESTQTEVNRLNGLLTTAEIRKKNAQQHLADCEEELQVELGPLAKAVLAKTSITCVALHPANRLCNDVTGQHERGHAIVVGAAGTDVSAFRMSDGYCRGIMHPFKIDDGEKTVIRGHTKQVTCVTLHENFIISGSMDSKIIVWDSQRLKWQRALIGHISSVWSVCAFSFGNHSICFSGSADSRIRVWDIETGECIRILRGHAKTINALDVNASILVSGSTDGEIRVWDFVGRKQIYSQLRCRHRLRMDEPSAITYLKVSMVETVAGTAAGELCIWDLTSGKLIQKCLAHEGAVQCLDFDATRIVSAGSDNLIKVTDVASGDALTTIYGHTGHVLVVQFDSTRIVSGSSDGTVRFWDWKRSNTEIPERDQYHIVANNETLFDISKKYKAKIGDLLKLNELKSAKLIFNGQRLLVKKAIVSPKKKDRKKRPLDSKPSN